VKKSSVFEWYKKVRGCRRCWKKCLRRERSNKNAEKVQNLAYSDETKLLARCMTEIWWGYETFAWKKPNLCPNCLFLHHDNASANKVLNFRLVMDKKQCLRYRTPPLFSRFPTHLLLAFPEIKVHLERTKISGLWRCSEGCESNAVSYSERDIHKCSQQWQQHQARCLAAQVGYF